MFGKRTTGQVLEPPPLANDREAEEVMRVWVSRGDVQQVALQTHWSDPAVWGLLLVDIARHVSQAYARQGRDAAETLARIRAGFDAEWSAPTDQPRDVTDKI
jgi:hypothetical protein